MSTSVYEIDLNIRAPETRQTVTPGPSEIHTDVLRKGYVLLRRLVPVIAAVTGWTQLHAGQVTSLRQLVTVSLTVSHLALFLLLMAAWNLCFRGSKSDSRSVLRQRFLRSEGSAVLLGSSVCTLLLLVCRHVFPHINLESISLTVFWLRCASGGLACVVFTAILYEMAYQLSTPRVYLIVGSRRRAVSVYKDLITHREHRNVVMGFVDSDATHAKYLPCDYLGGVDKLEQILVNNPVDQVCLAMPVRSQYEAVQECVSICERVGVRYSYATDIFQTELGRSIQETPYRFKPGIKAAMTIDDGDALLKRAIDILAATVLLIVLAPLMLVIALSIKLTSPGPAFFVQSRCGRNRRSFRMFKFRSMVANAEHLMAEIEHRNEVSGPIFKLKEDPRVTKLGRILRKTSMDELPQLVNVLKGDMSLVGPRPMSFRDVRLISESNVMRRFSVTPGITGLWQISGRSNTDFDTWIRLDLQYIDRWSLRLDLQILLQTVPAVLYSRGAV